MKAAHGFENDGCHGCVGVGSKPYLALTFDTGPFLPVFFPSFPENVRFPFNTTSLLTCKCYCFVYD